MKVSGVEIARQSGKRKLKRAKVFQCEPSKSTTVKAHQPINDLSTKTRRASHTVLLRSLCNHYMARKLQYTSTRTRRGRHSQHRYTTHRNTNWGVQNNVHGKETWNSANAAGYGYPARQYATHGDQSRRRHALTKNCGRPCPTTQLSQYRIPK